MLEENYTILTGSLGIRFLVEFQLIYEEWICISYSIHVRIRILIIFKPPMKYCCQKIESDLIKPLA